MAKLKPNQEIPVYTKIEGFQSSASDNLVKIIGVNNEQPKKKLN